MVRLGLAFTIYFLTSLLKLCVWFETSLWRKFLYSFKMCSVGQLHYIWDWLSCLWFYYNRIPTCDYFERSTLMTQISRILSSSSFLATIRTEIIMNSIYETYCDFTYIHELNLFDKSVYYTTPKTMFYYQICLERTVVFIFTVVRAILSFTCILCLFYLSLLVH
jgi:hypothetical protein